MDQVGSLVEGLVAALNKGAETFPGGQPVSFHRVDGIGQPGFMEAIMLELQYKASTKALQSSEFLQ